MSIAVWPEAEMPLLHLVGGYGREPSDTRIVGQTVPARIRRGSSRAIRPMTVQTILEVDQLYRLHRFWETDTRGGVRPFQIREPILDGRPMLTVGGDPMLTEDDEIILIEAWMLVRFAAPYQESAISDRHFRISMQLEELP